MILPKIPQPAWLQAFLPLCHPRRYDKNVEFIRKGEPAESLYYLVEGSVAAVIDDEEQREIVLAYINKGEFIGEMGLFTPQTTRSVIIRTRTPCRVAEITYKRLERLLES